MSSVNQEDEFTEVTRKCKKRKASGSPTLPTLQKTGSSESPPETPVSPRPNHKKKKGVLMLTLKRADVGFEQKARVLDSLCLILGQTLTGSYLRLRTYPSRFGSGP